MFILLREFFTRGTEDKGNTKEGGCMTCGQICLVSENEPYLLKSTLRYLWKNNFIKRFLGLVTQYLHQW